MPFNLVNNVGIQHGYGFDPTYGYSREALLQVQGPDEVAGFADYWRRRHQTAMQVDPQPRVSFRGYRQAGWLVCKLRYESVGGVRIRGWALVPDGRPVRRGFVVLHGYGGRDAPDFHLPFDDAVLLFPCLRGISRSPLVNVPWEPEKHVLYGIEGRDQYIIGGCVEDTWLGVSALLRLFPQVQGRVGLLGISFGGGVGTLALPWDARIGRAHFNVPTFGNQPLRMRLPTVGSGEAIRRLEQARPGLAAPTLAWYDAAVAARHVRVPVHCACALFDPAVAPPGQFSVYNGLQGERRLFVLTCGHHEYPGQSQQEAQLLQELHAFFAFP